MHVPVHNHSEYSNLDGLSTVQEIAERCVELGCPCCGLTDHATVSGHLEFGKVMQKHGIKPIYGCEFYHGVKTEFGKNERDQAHFVAGALNNKGLRNLWSLVDASAPNFRYVSRVDWDMLRKYSEGMFATSACIQGLVAQGVLKEDPYDALNKYLDIYGDNFYIEIHTYPGYEHEQLNLDLVGIAEERGLPLLYADDAHFARPEQYELHDAYVAMQSGQTIYTPVEERKMWHPKSLYIKTEDEIREALSYLPDWAVDDAIRNSVDLGERVDAELPEVKRHLPVFVPAESRFVPERFTGTAAELLLDLVEQGIEVRYGSDASEEVWERASRELEVFLDAGLEHYFLLAWDLVQFCKDNDIEIGPGRGSAAGCLVAYVLGITDVDPLHFGLVFERFFNAGREDGFPDIDMDFPRARRRDILHYLEERWGKDRVRPIGTIMRMKPKAVIDKTWKAAEVTFDEAAELKRILDEVPDIEIHGVDQIGWSEETEPGKTIYVMREVGDKIVEWVESKGKAREEILVNWLWMLEHLCSRVQNYGIHPSGIVVSDTDLPGELPCRWNKDEKLRITMFPMDDVDKRKFIKMDVLGLRTLDTLTEWKKLVKENAGIDINWSGMEQGEYPEEMWQLFDRGLTLGLFQIEDKNAVRRLVKDFKPRSVEDLSIIVALNRPGPLRSGAGDDFTNRKHGREEVQFDHPFLEDILSETYGIFLYQEDVIALFNKMGYTLSESDAVRKILGKKKPEALKALHDGLGEWEGKGWIDVAPKFLGDKSEVVWKKLEGFASYSFNKSHSVCYGTVTFRTDFAKYYAPAEFAMACIRTDEKRAGKHVGESRRMDISILPPDILLSMDRVTADDEGNLRYGFNDIKGIKGDSGKYLVELRNRYGDVIRTRGGLEDVLEQEKEEWKQRQDDAKVALRPFKEKSPAQRLRSNQIDALQLVGAFDEYEERLVTLQQRQQAEKDLLGVILTDNSEQVFKNNHDLLLECDSYEEVDLEYEEDMRYTIPGVIVDIRETKTRAKGDSMGIVQVEYEGDQVEFAVFPQQWKSYKFLFKERTPGIFTLRKTQRGLNFEEGRKLT
jgi:DNA polymerase III subunit alpha